ncbi:hypothetical protein D0T66_06725 [Dysgonomonas sp. 25]|nr:hypothetical protein [Dysgonomonas sp. 25]
MLRNNYLHLLIILLINIIYTAGFNYFIQTDDLYYSFLLENYPDEIAERVFQVSQSYNFLVYLLPPVLIILRTLIFATILDAILACKDIFREGQISQKYKFEHYWRIFICAEWSFIIFLIVRLYWFGFINTEYGYKDLTDFSPLSLYSLIGYEGLEDWLIFPLKTINLFEVIYIVLAVIACKKILKISYFDSIFYINLSYVMPFILFIVFIVYLSLYLQ